MTPGAAPDDKSGQLDTIKAGYPFTGPALELMTEQLSAAGVGQTWTGGRAATRSIFGVGKRR